MLTCVLPRLTFTFNDVETEALLNTYYSSESVFQCCDRHELLMRSAARLGGDVRTEENVKGEHHTKNSHFS